MLAYSFVVTTLIALVLKAVMGIRIDAESEIAGIDQGEHAETGYELGGMSTGSSLPAFAGASARIVT